MMQGAKKKIRIPVAKICHQAIGIKVDSKHHLGIVRCLILAAACLPLAPAKLYSWQNDIEVNLRQKTEQFATKNGFGYLGGAVAEVRLVRYLAGDRHHIWRGGVEGDIALFHFSQALLWQMSLSIETLGDEQNEINFRLVQLYYQALTGMRWRIGKSGMVHLGYRHRCSHGADGAEDSRITIRSGVTADYHWTWRYQALRLDIRPGLNYYVLGQNRDYLHQQVGNAFISGQGSIELQAPISLILSAGLSFDLIGRGQKVVYIFSDRIKNLWVDVLFSTRLAMRITTERLKNDIGVHFSQSLDSGIGPTAEKISTLAFIMDFFW